MHRYSNKLKLFILVILSLGLNSCSGSVGNYFSTRYENVMGYFNTYYNVKNTFNEAVVELEKSTQVSRDTNYFTPYQPNPTIKVKFGTVIEKASKIIQYYPRSKWVDDAIMMIGKSYYYQNEYDLALKKFNELIDNFPNSDYFWEAKLLSARTLFNANKTLPAQSYLNGFLNSALEAGEEDIGIEGYLLLGQIHFKEEEYQKAITVYKNSFKINGDGYLLALSAYQLARCYELVEEYENSNAAYLKVLDYSPGELLRFRALLNYGQTLTEIKRYSEAMQCFNNLRDEPLTKDQLSQVDLEIANTYNAMDEFDIALDHYQLIDSLYQRTDASAKSFYNRGLMYEFKLNDYSEAKFYYDKAKTEYSQSEITPLAAKKSEAFSKYFKYHNEIIRYDSLFYAAIKWKSEELNKSVTTADSSIVVEDSLEGNTSTMLVDSVSVDEKTVQLALQDSIKEIPSHIGDNLMSRAERMADDSNVVPDYSLDDVEVDRIEERISLDDKPVITKTTDSTNAVPTKQPAQTIAITPDSALFMVIKNQYELATLFHLDLSKADSAEFWYDLVARSINGNVFVPRAIYALAEIKRIKDDTNSMDSLHTCLIDNFTNSEYAAHVKKLRGMAIESQKSKPEELYEDGIRLIEKNKSQESISVLKQIFQNDTTSLISPKAIYAAGWVYENLMKNNDSAKALYKILIDKYPNSVYTENVIGKVAVSDDTTNLSKYTKIKELIPPPPPTPKFTNVEKSNTNVQTDQNTQSSRRDVREEDSDEDAPEIDIDDEEPPN